MEWLDKLAASGVAVDVLTFHDDPRTCYDTGKRRRAYRLATVLAQHHRATVLVFAESRVLYTPADSLEPWAQSLWALPRRALFTPELPYRWGHREWTLASEGFVVLPANVAGFRLFGEAAVDWRIDRLFPASYARGYPRSLSANTERWLSRDAPTKEVVQDLVRQVKGYLGPKGFEWLCACAVYPQIAWPLTLYLARHNGARLDLLPAPGRLPWLRYGFMPDWLRGTLIAQMTAEQDGNVRCAIESLLEEIAAAAKPADATQPRAGGGALTVARWIGPADLLGAAPAGSPLSDRVFLGFMSRSNVDPLSVSVKDSLLGLFRGRAKAFEAEQPTPDAETPSREESRSRILVSYRRSDTAAHAGRLMDALRARWPETGIFFDNASIVSGADWRSTIEEALRGADLVLAIVGPGWIERYASDGVPPEPDAVQREIAAALVQEKRVIPVLVGGASMPSEQELPPDLRPLARRNAIELRNGAWEQDVERLLERIAPFIRTARKSRPDVARTRTSMRTRAVDAAAAGRQAACVALARLREIAAYRPFTAAGVVGAMVGLAAALVLWRLLPYELVPVAPDSGLSFAAFSPDGRLLAVRDAAGQAMLVDVASGATTPLRAAIGGGATAAAFARDGSTLFVGYRDGALRNFRMPTGEQTRASLSPITSGEILALGVRADDSLVVARSNGITIVSSSTGAVQGNGFRPGEAYILASFDPTANYVAVAVREGGMRVDPIGRSIENRALAPIFAASGCALSVAPALSDDRIACADVDGRAIAYVFWKAPPAVPVRMETAPGEAPAGLAFTFDNRLLAVLRGNAVAFFDAVNARPLGSVQLAGAGRAAAFSTSGNTFAVAGQTSVEFFDVAFSASTGGNIGPSRDDVIAAQEALNLLGYDAGGADGSMGARTRAAVTKFQQDKGLPATGALDDSTLAALRSAQPPGTTQVQTDLVPSIVGMTVNAARELLDRHQFVFGTQLIRPSSARVDTITSQSPAQGTRAPTAAKVDVVLSDGSLVRVPNVVGLDIGIAEKKMVAAGLKPSRSGNGPVRSQNPVPRTEVVRNAEVRLIVESAGDDTPAASPNINAPPPGQGWCCIRTLGVVMPMSADGCSKNSGGFNTSQAAASKMCPRVPAIQGGSKF